MFFKKEKKEDNFVSERIVGTISRVGATYYADVPYVAFMIENNPNVFISDCVSFENVNLTLSQPGDKISFTTKKASILYADNVSQVVNSTLNKSMGKS